MRLPASAAREVPRHMLNSSFSHLLCYVQRNPSWNKVSSVTEDRQMLSSVMCQIFHVFVVIAARPCSLLLEERLSELCSPDPRYLGAEDKAGELRTLCGCKDGIRNAHDKMHGGIHQSAAPHCHASAGI